jgi:saccharopepsin
MMSQKVLKNNMFAFYLTTNNQDSESDLTFGYYDKTKFTGDLVWHPVLFKYMFGIQLDDIKVNGKSLGFCGPNGIKKDCLVTVDSGTTMMAMPSWAYEKIHNTIPTHDTPVSCKEQSQFGELTWVINGHEYTLRP